ncbi:exodeoxyribonuclease V subunit beta [Alkalilimnicola sp. S0819]|uniref:exodeoxyribonuclease V subunit beta n=1 Tax=Alkalilimnicola sp. S0819 TaxID=2613922 RepID=UPI001261A9AF|nr:exodeoxyribonuclease V subunit beta [Alkalilimnicola sp. S0819]KAB7627775.1 exodeoxyribonuclease V subunit beta [Alkalilimnicola sp. S0819]MPQ15401.1 exodeoxyribonuclease V subunit beta [Alkalilimnicola sp. S0819]
MSQSTLLQPLSFPLHGSRLIEASAGTGKTWTIAALYLRLVLAHGREQPLLPPQILVVTFTEAATQELRERIRDRLSEAARYFREELHEADPFLRELRDQWPPEEWPACAYQLDCAADWMDEAAVSTIHAWCYRMLREHAFDSGSLFTQNLETDQGPLYEEAARDYWRCFVFQLGAGLLADLQSRWSTPDSLLGAVRGLIGHVPEALADADLLARMREAEVQREQELRRLKSPPWAQWCDELEALLNEARGRKAFNGNKLQQRFQNDWLNKLRAWAADPAADALDLKTGFKRLTPEGLGEIWKQGEAPAHPALAAIAELSAALAALPTPCGEVPRHAAAWIQRRVQQAQRRRAELGFDDLLRRLDEALATDNGERLAEVIRKQFPVAMIDEFQDTDPVQYRIFQRVYRLEESPAEQGLFLIGDPKQAIYAFRGADIHTYLQARRATRGRHYTLGRNFRSTEAMVAAVNRVFEHAEQQCPRGAFLFRDGPENPLPFHPVDAQGRDEALYLAGAPQPALNIWMHGEQALSKDDYLRRMSAVCATQMVRLLQQGELRDGEGGTSPVRPRDMAVLVRNRTEADAIRGALAARGLRSVYLSDKESVYACAEAQDLLRWLCACAEPESDRLLRAALATRTLGLDWQALDRLNTDELHWEAEVLRFRDYRRRWHSQGVLPMLRQLIHDFRVPERLLAEDGGERRLTDLLHLAELLQQSATELDGEQALIRHLAEQLEQGESTDEQVIRLESDEDLIKLVTIHKSKGLEYPLVFLPFVCGFREVRKEDRPLRYHNDQGELVLALEADEGVLARADQERLAEDLRLLYVALTRARHACWLGVAPLKVGNSKACQLHKGALGHVLGGGAPLASEDVAEAVRALCAGHQQLHALAAPEPDATRWSPPRADAGPGRARTVARPAREHWWIASYSALRLGATAPDEDRLTGAPDSPMEDIFSEATDEPSEPPALPRRLQGLHAFPRGPNPGTFLHGLLEWAGREGFGEVLNDPELLRDTVYSRCARRGYAPHAEMLHAWLRDYLQTPLALPGAEPVSLAELDRRGYQCELEFWFQVGDVASQRLDARVRARTLGGAPRPTVLPSRLNGMFKGFVDLVFEHQGRYYLADYKSNWLGADESAYTVEAMREAVLEKRYDLQYVLYTLALHRLLRARLPDYDYQRHMGGAAYLFLRGGSAASGGLHWERPPAELIEELDALFRGRRAGAALEETPA